MVAVQKNHRLGRGAMALVTLPLRIYAAAAKSQPESFDLQEKCAKQAHEGFKLGGWEKVPGAWFVNHYHEKLNKCFVEIGNTSTAPGSSTFWVNKFLSDAFEGTGHGQYSWHSDPVKKYWEMPPFMCSVKLESGEKKTCTSSDEFDYLVKRKLWNIRVTFLNKTAIVLEKNSCASFRKNRFGIFLRLTSWLPGVGCRTPRKA